MMKRFLILCVLAVTAFSFAFGQQANSQRKAKEDAFINSMKEMAKSDAFSKVGLDTAGLRRATGSDIYIKPGKTYILNDISSTTYYMRQNSTLVPVCDSELPVQTISNRMLLVDKGIADGFMRIVFQKYRYDKDSIDISMKQFVTFCKRDGYQAYVGIESADEKSIHSDVFLYNSQKKVLHIFNISWPIQAVADKGLTVHADAWLFIPTNNIKQLMGPKLPKNFMQDLMRKVNK